MKLTCSKDALIDRINIVSKAVSSRTTLPVLECILLTADSTNLTLTGSDLEIGIKSSPISATVEKEGSVAIEAKLFSEIIRRLNGESVTIDANGNEAVIKCGFSEFTLMTQPAEDFPALPEVEKEFSYKISQPMLRDMINSTIFSVALDESKPFLTGELIEFKPNSTNIVSVDGFRISYRMTESENSKESKVIVPAKTMREISRILSGEEEKETEIFITDKHILFSMNGNTVVSRIIEGDYIKYEQTFTDSYKTRVVLDRSLLISSLERASLISRDARKMPVKLEIGGSKIIITSQTEIGKAYEEVEAAVEGEELKIAFNPRYLIDALKAIEDENVSIQFNSPLGPCIIKPVEGELYKYLILPLRM